MFVKQVEKYFCQLCHKEFSSETEAREHEYHHLQKPTTLATAIAYMETAVNKYDLSDKYLLTNGQPTRREVFCGEYNHGITMVPASFALNLAKLLLAETKNDKLPIYYE